MNLGITQLQWLVITARLKRRLKRVIDANGDIDVYNAVRYAGYVFYQLGKFSEPPIFKRFCFAQRGSFNALSTLIQEIGGVDMAKVKLGITIGEITGMLPDAMQAAWGFWSDDKQITADEGALFVGFIMNQMSEAADHPKVKEFFLQQAEAINALAPILAEVVDAGSEADAPDEG